MLLLFVEFIDAACASVIGWPAASDSVIFAAPAGSTPTTRTCGALAFIASATPDASPPPPMGT